jgi:2-aminoethylphosphonate-pyruvate transaminase
MDDDAPYLLLTPGPLSTSPTVKRVMMRDYCTWDDDYNGIVTNIRHRLVELAGAGDDYTAVLMQGSGTFAVEATIGTAIPEDGKLLAVNNGAYGSRIAQIARRLRIPCVEITLPETQPAAAAAIDARLRADAAITHVAVVHCETTTGLLNPAEAIGHVVRAHNRIFILDAMSSFGGIPMRIDDLAADFLVSSANKCIQGVPGFGFVIARRSELEACDGRARSLSLDLFDQWKQMEEGGGKWRYTSPTHTVRAFAQALDELDAEGGVAARHARYAENQRRLAAGMRARGFQPLLPDGIQSPIITSFLYPSSDFSFRAYYDALKQHGFVIYPGKISQAETFRIGTIGHVFPADIDRLLKAIDAVIKDLGLTLTPT